MSARLETQSPNFDNFLKSMKRSPSDDFESLNLGSDDDPKLVRIGKALSTSEKQAFTSFLKDRVQSFAFSYEDMPGLDSNLVEHKLPIKPGAQPVKARHFS